MSILIKGMKMPKSCDECFVMLSLCSAARKIAKSCGPRMWVPTTYRPDDCPLTEISQPHGRLIDADALLKDNSRKYDMYRRSTGRDTRIDDACHRAIQWTIEDAPTVIQASEEGE